MTNIICVTFIFTLVFFAQSCYTIVEQRKVNNTFYESQAEFPQNYNIQNDLIGVWINKQLWMDYGYQYRRLEIYENGRVVYMPRSESNNSKIYNGIYTVSADTLIMNLGNKPSIVWMKYRLNADTLFIRSFKEEPGTENDLINDCYDCTRNWIKYQ
jgi:hypothetical protein